MKSSNPTLPFHILLASGEKVIKEAPSLEKLIDELYPDETEFHRGVVSVTWKEKSTLCVYDTTTRSLKKSIADADINPYGWRQQHR
jgi:hypothetical protein